jgi:hypothetical protein
MSETTAAGLVPGGDQEQTKDAALNRACEYCRGLKVRCFPEPGSSSSTCQRCARSKRICVFAAPQRRKQRKRTDVRIAELEKEMRALRLLLKRGSDGGDQAMEDLRVSEQTGRDLEAAQDTPPDITISSREADDHINRGPIPQVSMEELPRGVFDKGDLDVVDRGLLSMASAADLYDIYINDLTPHYPAVTFPKQYTVVELRGERPTLFLAVMSAASGKTDPNLHNLLNAELLQLFASRAVIGGEKSLEFVQSMLVTAVWYYPTETFDQLKFYQYIHMAATIALDIGLGSKPNITSFTCGPSCDYTGISSECEIQTSHGIAPQPAEKEPDIAAMDARRTILVCYLICSG